MPKARYSIYVIELDSAVLKHRKFTAANPDYQGDRPCVYVGMTARTPEERFAQHKHGYRSNSYVRRYGLRLRPRLYQSLNPLTYEDACAMERERARRLRARGYAVWQN